MILIFAYVGHGVSIDGDTNAITIEEDGNLDSYNLVSMLRSEVLRFNDIIVFAILDCCRNVG